MVSLFLRYSEISKKILMLYLFNNACLLVYMCGILVCTVVLYFSV